MIPGISLVKAFHKLLEFSQKTAHNPQKVAQKLPFVTKVAPPKVAPKNKTKQNKNCCSLPLFGLMQKYNKNNISKHFCAIFRRNQYNSVLN